jgi:3-hydroxypropanoate dehydrogenase
MSNFEQLFESARTHHGWQNRPISDELIHQLYDRLRWAPTSANSNPGRFVFVRSPEAKARLEPCMAAQNAEKTMASAACVIVAADTRFYDLLLQIYPGRDMRSMFADAPVLAEETWTRNATLQGAYLIIAARSLGLDCGPMSGFNRSAVDREFFPDGRWRSDFLVNLGYGDPAQVRPRNPRLEFEQACQIL